MHLEESVPCFCCVRPGMGHRAWQQVPSLAEPMCVYFKTWVEETELGVEEAELGVEESVLHRRERLFFFFFNLKPLTFWEV